MWTIIGTFLKANAVKLLLWGILAAAFAGYTALVYQAGKNAVVVKELKETVKTVEKKNEIRTKIKRMPSGAALDELRRNWSR